MKLGKFPDNFKNTCRYYFAKYSFSVFMIMTFEKQRENAFCMMLGTHENLSELREKLRSKYQQP